MASLASPSIAPQDVGRRRAGKWLLFLLCCLTDVFVLRNGLVERRIDEDQFRRGYFETFAEHVGLAVDNAVSIGMVPTFHLTSDGTLGIPPGMVAVAPISAAVRYVLATDAPAPYIVVGTESPVDPVDSSVPLLPGEARLTGGRTLTLRDGRLALIAWDPVRPWHEDAERLSRLRSACTPSAGGSRLTLAAKEGQLEIRFGDCSLSERLPAAEDSPLLLGVLAGTEWVTVTRQPDWSGQPSLVWQVLAVILIKVAAIWWALGPASAVATSAVLGLAALYLPVPAMLTYPLFLLVGVGAATVRAAAFALRKLPPLPRIGAAFVLFALVGGFMANEIMQPRSFPPISSSGSNEGESAKCTLLGYSTVKGEGLRRERGGLRHLLDRRCGPCEGETAGLFAGGETLAWLQEGYCNTPDSFGADGLATFLGGVNDDFFWGRLSLPRLFLAGQLGADAWRRNQGPAAAASLARIDDQVSALGSLMRCAGSRRADFFFVHDFLVTDLANGRDPDRAAMLEARRAAVEAAGGTFIDLLQLHRADAGVSWFNDYVHLSAPVHEKVAALACDQLSRGSLLSDADLFQVRQEGSASLFPFDGSGGYRIDRPDSREAILLE